MSVQLDVRVMAMMNRVTSYIVFKYEQYQALHTRLMALAVCK